MYGATEQPQSSSEARSAPARKRTTLVLTGSLAAVACLALWHARGGAAAGPLLRAAEDDSTCRENSECGSGYKCVFGTCYSKHQSTTDTASASDDDPAAHYCDETADCEFGYKCESGSCSKTRASNNRLNATTATVADGDDAAQAASSESSASTGSDTCSTTSDCDVGYRCNSKGVCKALAQTDDGAAAADDGADAATQVGSSASTGSDTCSTTSDCDVGYRCSKGACKALAQTDDGAAAADDATDAAEPEHGDDSLETAAERSESADDDAAPQDSARAASTPLDLSTPSWSLAGGELKNARHGAEMVLGADHSTHYGRAWFAGADDDATLWSDYNVTVRMNWRGEPSEHKNSEHAIVEALAFRATNFSASGSTCGFDGYYCALYLSTYSSMLELRRCSDTRGYKVLARSQLSSDASPFGSPAERASSGPWFNLTASAHGEALSCSLATADDDEPVTVSTRDETFSNGLVGLVAYRTKFAVASMEVALASSGAPQ